MSARAPSYAVGFVLVSGSVFAACGSEEMFEPHLADNERLISREAVATWDMDDQGLDRLVVVGDIDGDGIDDAIVRSYYFASGPDGVGDESSGDAYVIYGGTLAGKSRLSTLPALTGIGWGGGLAPAGDVDGDGLADFLVGVRVGTNSGAYLVYGSTTRISGKKPIADTAVFFNGPTKCIDAAGVAGLGDLDGDGHADFAVTVDQFPSTTGATSLFLIYGTGRRLSGTLELASAADAVISTSEWQVPGIARAGDVDGDGHGDFLLHMSQSSVREGVRLVRGSTKRLAGALAPGDLPPPRFTVDDHAIYGSHGAALGDLDGDGFDDFYLLIRKESLTAPFTFSTTQHLYYGHSEWLSPTSESDATFVMSGASVSRLAAGDVDHDGIRDLLVSDAGVNDKNGAVHILRGTGARLSGTIDLASTTTYIGETQRATICGYTDSKECIEHAEVGTDLWIGDLTGDDRADILVGARTDQLVGPELGVQGSAMAHAYLVSLSAKKP